MNTTIINLFPIHNLNNSNRIHQAFNNIYTEFTTQRHLICNYVCICVYSDRKIIKFL